VGPQAGCPWFSRGEWQLRLTRSSLADSFNLVHPGFHNRASLMTRRLHGTPGFVAQRFSLV